MKSVIIACTKAFAVVAGNKSKLLMFPLYDAPIVTGSTAAKPVL
ncbi:hypothetical protein [Spongorhabdus nitratireducens]